MDTRGWTERLPKWLLNWMASLLPSQTSHGDNAVQVGEVNGELRIDKQAVTMVVTQNFYSAQVESHAAANGVATPEQRALLTQIRRLPGSGESVFRWMERNFGTRMVIGLRPHEARRLQSYVAGVERNLANKTQGTPCRESA